MVFRQTRPIIQLISAVGSNYIKSADFWVSDGLYKTNSKLPNQLSKLDDNDRWYRVTAFSEIMEVSVNEYSYPFPINHYLALKKIVSANIAIP